MLRLGKTQKKHPGISHPSTAVFSHEIIITNEPRIAKLDAEMLHHECWKSVYFGVKRSKAKVTRHENIADMGHGPLVSTDFFVVCLLLYFFAVVLHVDSTA